MIILRSFKDKLVIALAITFLCVGFYSLVAKVCFIDKIPAKRDMILGLKVLPAVGDADAVICLIN